MNIEPIHLNTIIKSSRDWFVDFELYISSELGKHLKAKFPIKPEDGMVIVDLDEDTPFHSLSNEQIALKYNGRFFIPETDKNDAKLTYSDDDWVEEVKGWFLKEAVQVKVGVAAKVLKFTAMVPSILVPGSEATESIKETPEKVSEAPAEPEAPVEEAPVEEAPVEEAPVETPKDKEPVTEKEPAKEEPAKETEDEKAAKEAMTV